MNIPRFGLQLQNRVWQTHVYEAPDKNIYMKEAVQQLAEELDEYDPRDQVLLCADTRDPRSASVDYIMYRSADRQTSGQISASDLTPENRPQLIEKLREEIEALQKTE